jgi:hypothetical protein
MVSDVTQDEMGLLKQLNENWRTRHGSNLRPLPLAGFQTAVGVVS